jgi:uncharacterized protein DUF5655
MAKTASRQDAGWRCPQCGRRFRQRTREHSCDVRPLAAHLDRGSAQVQEIAADVLDVLARLGPHGVVPVKTMILVRATSNFGGLIVRRDALDVRFILPRPLSHGRIRKTERMGPSKYAYEVRLLSAADVDAQLKGWLREAYDVAAEAAPRRARKTNS